MDLGACLQLNSEADIDWDLMSCVILLPYAYDVKKNTKMRNNGKDNNSAVDAENKRRCLKITPKLKTPMAIRTLMPEQ